jgi:hypothetical protein
MYDRQYKHNKLEENRMLQHQHHRLSCLKTESKQPLRGFCCSFHNKGR